MGEETISSGLVLFEPIVGLHLTVRDAIQAALDEAKSSKTTQLLRSNDVLMHIYPNSDVDQVLEGYNRTINQVKV